MLSILPPVLRTPEYVAVSDAASSTRLVTTRRQTNSSGLLTFSAVQARPAPQAILGR